MLELEPLFCCLDNLMLNRGPRFGLQTHMVAHSHLESFKGSDTIFLQAQVHMSHTDVYAGKTIRHIKNKTKKFKVKVHNRAFSET